MQVLFSTVGFLGVIGLIFFVKFLDLSAGLTAAIVSLLVFFAVYMLARIPPGKKSE